MFSENLLWFFLAKDCFIKTQKLRPVQSRILTLYNTFLKDPGPHHTWIIIFITPVYGRNDDRRVKFLRKNWIKLNILWRVGSFVDRSKPFQICSSTTPVTLKSYPRRCSTTILIHYLLLTNGSDYMTSKSRHNYYKILTFIAENNWSKDCDALWDRDNC